MLALATALPAIDASHATFSDTQTIVAPNPASSVTEAEFVAGACSGPGLSQGLDGWVYNVAGFGSHRAKTLPLGTIPDFDLHQYSLACAATGSCGNFGAENCVLNAATTWIVVVYFAGLPNTAYTLTITCNSAVGPPGC